MMVLQYITLNHLICAIKLEQDQQPINCILVLKGLERTWTLAILSRFQIGTKKRLANLMTNCTDSQTPLDEKIKPNNGPRSCRSKAAGLIRSPTTSR